MELTTITTEIHEAQKRLKEAGTKLFELAREKAETEREYRKALAHAVLEREEEGRRATLIPDLARGDCADVKFERDLADARYTAGREAVGAIETQISALQTILRYHESI